MSPRRSKFNGAYECTFIIHAQRDYCANTITHLRCRMCCVLAGVLCQRSFCHMYWGCQRMGCQGCLAPFSGKCQFQQNSLGGSHCWACLLLGNFFKHGSSVAFARTNILDTSFFLTFACIGIVWLCMALNETYDTLGRLLLNVSNFRASLWVTVMLMFVMPFFFFFLLILELNLTDKCLDGVLNNNSYESEVLQVKLTLWTFCFSFCHLSTSNCCH